MRGSPPSPRAWATRRRRRCFRRRAPAGADRDLRHLRRGGHRCGPQRPHLCGVSRGGGDARVHRRAPRGGRWRGGHRGIPPRLSQFDGKLHGEPARPRGHSRPPARRAWSGRARAAARQFPALGRRVRGRVSRSRRRPSGHAGRGGEVLASRRRRASRVLRDARARGRDFALARRQHATERGRRVAAGRGVGRVDAEGEQGLSCARPCGATRSSRSFHQECRGPPRSVVRQRADQGRIRLRRRGWQLRESVRARVGLRALAPRHRRGQRQAWAVGTRRGWDGRDHAGDGERMRRAWGDDSHGRAGRARSRRRRPRHRCRASTAARRSRQRASSPT